MLSANLGYFADILHGYGLSAAAVASDGEHHEGDVFHAIFIDSGAEFGDVHITFEGAMVVDVGCFVNRAIQGYGIAEFYVSFGGVKMCVSGDYIAGFQHCRKENVLGCTALVGGHHVGESQELGDGFFEASEAG